MSEYIFEENRDDHELRRLRLIEQARDEESIGRLRSSGIRRGWRCLELGAGAGSLTQWIGDAVGDCGQVVAIDLNTNHLRHLSGANYQIIQGDFAAEGLQILQVDSRLHLNRGGDTMARMMGESTKALRDKYVATGEADPTDIEKHIENANNNRMPCGLSTR